jgi:YaiO family outer membrane protein
VRWNISSPGSVFTQSQYVAVTQGRDKHHFVVLRAGFGREGYQVVGPANTLVDFHSQEASVTWRQWLKRPWGFNAVVEYYHNPFYQRAGVSVGVFREF